MGTVLDSTFPPVHPVLGSTFPALYTPPWTLHSLLCAPRPGLYIPSSVHPALDSTFPPRCTLPWTLHLLVCGPCPVFYLAPLCTLPRTRFAPLCTLLWTLDSTLCAEFSLSTPPWTFSHLCKNTVPAPSAESTVMMRFSSLPFNFSFAAPQRKRHTGYRRSIWTPSP